LRYCETVVVDVVEEPVPGVTVVTEFEVTEVHEVSGVPEEPEEGEGSEPPGSEEPERICVAARAREMSSSELSRDAGQGTCGAASHRRCPAKYWVQVASLRCKSATPT
jgi:hypothetical protein